MSFFHKNTAAPATTSSSALLGNPVWNNAAQMNENFLNHGANTLPLQSNKLWSQPTLLNAQGVQQPSTILAPQQSSFIAPQQSSFAAPLNNFSSFNSSRQYRSAGQYRPIRLRTRNWGERSEFGWTKFNRAYYYDTASWEPKNVILEELRSQRGLNRGLESSNFNTLPLQSALPLQTAPLLQAQPLQTVKSSRGHHHGLRKKRAQAVLPVQSLAGGPAIATIGQQQLLQQQLLLPTQQLPLQQQQWAQTRSLETLPQQQLLSENRQTIVRPAIVEQTFRTDKVIEVQPILHREIEQPIINHIVKHQTEAPAPSMGGVVRMAPVVQETVATRVIDEVQPIIHREVAQLQTERVVEDLYENVSAPAQHTKSVQYERDFLPSTAPVQAPILSAPRSTVPTTLETINAPAIHSTTSLAPRVEETIRTDRLVEITPIIHRNIEVEQINHIEKHITEPAAASRGGVIRNTPIVQETVNTRVIDEVQPIIHRELAQIQTERVVEDLYENIVAPAQHTQAVQYENAVLPSNGLSTSSALRSSATLAQAPLMSTLPLTQAPLASAPMTASVPITKVVPSLEKQQPIAPISPFGAAAM